MPSHCGWRTSRSNGARHNVVFVATEHDSLYAFDADATRCLQLWKVSLIDASHGGSGTRRPCRRAPPATWSGWGTAT